MLVWLQLLACACDRDTAAPGLTVGVLAEGILGGALLSAWSDGEVVRMVGGAMDGGVGLVVEYDGETLCTRTLPETMWWISGREPGDYWMVGVNGAILHYTAAGAVDERVPTAATLYGVYDDGERVWAVGGDATANTGEIWAREDGAWRLHTTTEGTVFKVWDGWFVGRGLILRLEGDQLVDLTPEDAPTLLTVRGEGDDVWAVGGDGVPAIVRWDGAAWSAVDPDPRCVSRPLAGVWSAPGETVWVAGMYGTVAGFDGEDWLCPELPPTSEHLHAAWQHGDEVLFVGGDLFNYTDNRAILLRSPAPDAPMAVAPCR